MVQCHDVRVVDSRQRTRHARCAYTPPGSSPQRGPECAGLLRKVLAITALYSRASRCSRMSSRCTRARCCRVQQAASWHNLQRSGLSPFSSPSLHRCVRLSASLLETLCRKHPVRRATAAQSPPASASPGAPRLRRWAGAGGWTGRPAQVFPQSYPLLKGRGWLSSRCQHGEGQQTAARAARRAASRPQPSLLFCAQPYWNTQHIAQ